MILCMILMIHSKPIMFSYFKKVKKILGFKFTLFSKRCILIGLNFWWLPSRHMFAPKRLGIQTFQLHFHYLSGVHNICACMFKKCAILPWWIVTLFAKCALRERVNFEHCTVFVLTYLLVCSKLVLTFLGELWTCFTKCAFNWKGEFWNT